MAMKRQKLIMIFGMHLFQNFRNKLHSNYMETKHYLLPVIVILSKLLSNNQNTEQDKLCNMGDIPLIFIVESYVL